MSNERVLITGASGVVGRFLGTRLQRQGRTLRLLDIVTPPAATESDEIVTGSINDADALAAAMDGVDALIHLGGQSREDAWSTIVATNIDGTHNVLEAARVAGVRRVILASSNHAVGFRTVGEDGPGGLRADTSTRPDTYYGVSKAVIEALGALYHHRFDMDVICIRIGTCFEAPWDVRGLSTWLSPDDAGRLFEACLSAPAPGYRIIWGVSDNTRRFCSLREAAELGYKATDNAEKFAAEILEKTGEPIPSTTPEFIGGGFTTSPLGIHNPI